MAKRKMASPACAACRKQRKKCSEQCVLAAHFPSDDPDKFAMVQSVFGTSYIVKLLQGLEAEQRADAVNSMVHEASARVKDPIHGSATSIYQLKKRIVELETQLAATQADLMNTRSQYDKLILIVGTGSQDAQDVLYPSYATSQPVKDFMYNEDLDPLPLWGPLWEL